MPAQHVYGLILFCFLHTTEAATTGEQFFFFEHVLWPISYHITGHTQILQLWQTKEIRYPASYLSKTSHFLKLVCLPIFQANSDDGYVPFKTSLPLSPPLIFLLTIPSHSHI